MSTIEKLERCFFEQGLAWQLRPSVTDELLRLLAQVKAEYAELQRMQQPADVPESVRRLMEYAGKQRREVSSPCITANEAIEIANHFSAYGREQALKEPPAC